MSEGYVAVSGGNGQGGSHQRIPSVGFKSSVKLF